ncbi:riboflavin kinase [Candidatus Peregrinibacteria bacterium]|nr:riboflavin kinase [Candidatus Peregrinibacteria bacterium]
MKFEVIKGLGQGKQLGFPTINLRRPPRFRLQQGVYACFAKISGKNYKSALYYGPKYNFGIKTPKLEVHLIGFKKSISPRFIEILRPPLADCGRVVKKVRGVRKFASVSALKKQIRADVAAVKKILQYVKLA